jgi:hypothetical protein
MHKHIDEYSYAPDPRDGNGKGGERRLKPLAEERQTPTGLDNPFWKPEPAEPERPEKRTA